MDRMDSEATSVGMPRVAPGKMRVEGTLRSQWAAVRTTSGEIRVPEHKVEKVALNGVTMSVRCAARDGPVRRPPMMCEVSFFLVVMVRVRGEYLGCDVARRVGGCCGSKTGQSCLAARWARVPLS